MCAALFVKLQGLEFESRKGLRWDEEVEVVLTGRVLPIICDPFESTHEFAYALVVDRVVVADGGL